MYGSHFVNEKTSNTHRFSCKHTITYIHKAEHEMIVIKEPQTRQSVSLHLRDNNITSSDIMLYIVYLHISLDTTLSIMKLLLLLHKGNLT